MTACLSSSVVLCLLYATAANNVVIECIARATPILVNPLAAVVEYLGPDYPLYACDEDEAALLLSLPGQGRGGPPVSAGAAAGDRSELSRASAVTSATSEWYQAL